MFHKVGRFLLIFFFGIFILVCFLPQIASSEWGKRQIVDWINLSIPGKIEIGELSLTWNGSQKIEGVRLKDPSDKVLFSAKKIETETSLWTLFGLSSNWKSSKVEGVEANIERTQEGVSSLSLSLGIHNTDRHRPFEPIHLSDTSFELKIDKKEKATSLLLFEGKIDQGEKTGSFDAKLYFQFPRNGIKLHSFLSENGKSPSSFITIKQFPADLIEEILLLVNNSYASLIRKTMGSYIDCFLKKADKTNTFDFSLQSEKTSIKGSLETKEGGLLAGTIFPSFLEIDSFSEKNFSLLSPTRLQFQFEEIEIPSLTDKQSLPLFLKGKAAIEKLALLVENHKVDCSGVEIKIELPSKNKMANLSGGILLEPFQSRIGFSCAFEKPASLHELGRIFEKNMQAQFEAKEFPLSIFLEKEQQKNIEMLIGKKANVSLKLKDSLLQVSLESDKIKVDDAKFKLSHSSFKLLKNTKIEWNPSHFSISELQLDALTFPFEKDAPFDIQFSADRFSCPVNLENARIKSLSFKEVKTSLKGNLKEKIKADVTGHFSYLSGIDGFSPLLQNPLKVNSHLNFFFDRDYPLEVDLKAENESTYINFSANYLNSILSLEKPLEIEFALTPEGFAEIGAILNRKIPKIKKTATVDFRLSPGSFDLKSLKLSDIEAKGTLSVNQFAIQEEKDMVPIFEELILNWSVDSPKKSIALQLEGLAYDKNIDKPSEIECYAEIENWIENGAADFGKSITELHLDLTHFPTEFLSFLSNFSDLSPVLGPVIDIDMKTKIDANRIEAGYFDLSADSSTLHVKTRLKIEDSITLFNSAKQSEITLTVTPESFLPIKQLLGIKDERHIRSPFTIKTKIYDLSIPYRSNCKECGKIKLAFESSRIQWNTKNSTPIRFSGNLVSNNLNQSAESDFSLFSSNEALFELQASIENPLKAERSAKVHLKGGQINTKIAEDLFLLSAEKSDQFNALFGKINSLTCEATIQSKLSHIKAALSSEKLNLSFSGKVQDGSLTLDSPLNASFELSNPLIASFLGKDSSLNAIIGSESPAKLTIFPDGFKLPVQPFSIEQLAIRKAILDLSKLHAKNEGDLKTVFSMLGSTNASRLIMWFTPVYLSIQDGLLKIERFDVLINDLYHLACWGKYRLLKNEGNFVLGLPLSSYSSLLKSEELTKVDELIPLPFRIKKNKISIDKTELSAKLSALLAKLQGNSTTKLIGGIASLLLGDPDLKLPAPTTEPFPWKGEQKEVPEKKKEKNKPLKQLKKDASKALEILSFPLSF